MNDVPVSQRLSALAKHPATRSILPRFHVILEPHELRSHRGRAHPAESSPRRSTNCLVSARNTCIWQLAASPGRHASALARLDSPPIFGSRTFAARRAVCERFILKQRAIGAKPTCGRHLWDISSASHAVIRTKSGTPTEDRACTHAGSIRSRKPVAQNRATRRSIRLLSSEARKCPESCHRLSALERID